MNKCKQNMLILIYIYLFLHSAALKCDCLLCTAKLTGLSKQSMTSYLAKFKCILGYSMSF